MGNPTQEILEQKVASLEGGESSVAFSTGMAAISAVMLSSLHKGDHFISTDALYGGTYSLFVDLKRLGIDVSFVDTSRAEEVEDAVREETKLIFLETPANPTMKISDIKSISKIAKEKNEDIKIVVDNTFMTPYFQRPLELGAEIVVHSATKYLCGHGDAMGGVVVGDREFVENIRKILVHYGGVISPFNAWLIIRGLKTLALRMERHEKNAIEVAKFLKEHAKVERVLYPGLDTFPYFGIAKRQMHGYGGMLSFELCSEEDVYSMLQKVNICKLAVSLGTA
jgi:methionine-gamma-lyase